MSERLYPFSFYVPGETPPGDVPEELRRKWIGVPLLIQRGLIFRDLEKGAEHMVSGDNYETDGSADFVYVSALVGLEALRAFGEMDAVEQWKEILAARHRILFPNNPERAAAKAVLAPFMFEVRPTDRIEQNPIDILDQFAAAGMADFGLAYVNHFARLVAAA